MAVATPQSAGALRRRPPRASHPAVPTRTPVSHRSRPGRARSRRVNDTAGTPVVAWIHTRLFSASSQASRSRPGRAAESSPTTRYGPKSARSLTWHTRSSTSTRGGAVRTSSTTSRSGRQPVPAARESIPAGWAEQHGEQKGTVRTARLVELWQRGRRTNRIESMANSATAGACQTSA